MKFSLPTMLVEFLYIYEIISCCKLTLIASYMVFRFIGEMGLDHSKNEVYHLSYLLKQWFPKYGLQPKQRL